MKTDFELNFNQSIEIRYNGVKLYFVTSFLQGKISPTAFRQMRSACVHVFRMALSCSWFCIVQIHRFLIQFLLIEGPTHPLIDVSMHVKHPVANHTTIKPQFGHLLIKCAIAGIYSLTTLV